MLPSKQKGLFLEFSDYAILAASTSKFEAPFEVERLESRPASTTTEELTGLFQEMTDVRPGQKVYAICSCYPANSFLRKTTFDTPGKLKDPAFLPSHIEQQFKIDLARYLVMPLRTDGTEYAQGTTPQRELLLCGTPRDGINQYQQRMLECDLYPLRIELGTVATVGAVMQYQAQYHPDDAVLHVEICQNQSAIYIFQDGKLEVSRPIPFGLEHMYPIIRESLNMKDDASAQRMLFSNTFDFAEMGPSLLKKIIKELQASCGFFEVQTGQSIEHLSLALLPESLSWITKTISSSLGIKPLEIDMSSWLRAQQITTSSAINEASLENRWLAPFSLMADLSPKPEQPQAVETDKKQ